MKKLLALLIISVLFLSLCACGESKKSDYDKEQVLRDNLNQLEDEYDKAKQNADQFRQDVDDYYDALNELEKYN